MAFARRHLRQHERRRPDRRIMRRPRCNGPTNRRLIVEVSAILHHVMTSPGRNDPCPCGSGRKYKHCCLRATDAEESARARLRTAEGVLVPALFSYAADEFGNDFFAEAWDEFFVWRNVPGDIAGSREFGTTFDPFFVCSFVPDETEDELPAGWPTEPLALHFLHHEVESCPDFQREFIKQACESHASFFVVESLVSGRSIDLKDILTGKRFHVLEQSASRTFHQGDLTYTRVVTAGGASIMIGAAPWIIPPSWHVHIIDFRDRVSPRRLMTRGNLFEYDIEIRELYHHIVDALVNPRLPELRNTDGDPIEMTTMTYELAVTTAEAAEHLRPLATLGDDVHIDGETFDSSGALTAATLSWIKPGNRKNKDWDNTILGNLRLDGSQLIVEANSARRRDRIVKEIAKRLGSGATLVETKVTDVVKELKNRRAAQRSEDVAATPIPPDAERTSELKALEAEFLRKHWDAWIDTKVPALGNRTPRQAAKTPRGRERLEALLSDYERSAKRSRSAFVPDIAELRRILGLA
jgi:SEC-C motif-containing protein